MKILQSDQQRSSELNICLANLLHPSFLSDTVLNHHSLLSLLSISVISVCQIEGWAIELNPMKKAHSFYKKAMF